MTELLVERVVAEASEADRLFVLWKKKMAGKCKGWRAVGTHTANRIIFLCLERRRRGKVIPKLVPQAAIISVNPNDERVREFISEARSLAYRQLYAKVSE